LKLGNLEFHIVVSGHVRLDGGAMFGVIPKTMWEKVVPPDASNRILLAMNSLLILAGGKRILVETGAGDKLSPKLRAVYDQDGPRLVEGLRAYGLHPDEIDIVVDTHLHFDHCGGNSRIEKDKVVPAFPNARYIVHKGEFEHANNPTERDRASYISDNYMPIEAANKFSLIESDRVIAPGVELIRVPGHTANMLCVKLEGGGKTAFLFADLVPMTPHL
jgi:glyoxylase-like metal-dependent hydrolase (beta-lactamase superfamily II)